MSSNIDEHSPLWIRVANPAIARIVDQIHTTFTELQGLISEDLKYQFVSQKPLQVKLQPLIDKGLVDAETFEPDPRAPALTLDEEWTLIQVHMQSDLVKLMAMFQHSRHLAIIHFLDVFESSLAKGNLLVAMICARALIEHVAQFHCAIKAFSKAEVPDSIEETRLQHGELEDQLRQWASAQSVDWLKLLDNPNEVKRGRVKYESRPFFVDKSVVNVLDHVDVLDKSIKGTRVVYEILSEFAHPNVGVVLALTKTCVRRIDSNSVAWTDEEISLDAPLAIFRTQGQVFERVFLVLGASIERFKALLPEAVEIRNRFQRMTQLLVRDYIAKRELNLYKILDAYGLCPCASGAKFKFCCRQRT